MLTPKFFDLRPFLLKLGETAGAGQGALPDGISSAGLGPMAIESENPYALPAAWSDGIEGMPGCWSVQGDYLVVRENAVLPPVDLDGRGSGGPVTPVVLRLAVPAGGMVVAWIVIRAAIVIWCIAVVRDFWSESRSLGALVLVVLVGVTLGPVVASRLIRRSSKAREGPAFLWGYASVPALRAMFLQARRRGWIATGAWLLPLLLIVLNSGVRDVMGDDDGMLSPEWMVFLKISLGAMVLSGCGAVSVCFWAAKERNWHCTKAQDGWLWIKGIGPAALAELAQRSATEPPPVVRRKVFKFRLQRLTLSEWRATNGLRPGAWWQTLLMMSRKPEGQEHLAFHWSERQWLEPRDGDAELVEAWQRDTAGTPLTDWRMTHAERIDSPTRCFRSEEIVFLSPDGRHAAMSMVARVATGKGLLEDRRETAFRSWTEDGRILATGNQRVSGPLPDEMEFEVRQGSPWEMAQWHLARVAEEPLLVVDAAGLRRKEEQEMQRRHEVLEDAGIYGPVEEMEMPGDLE